MYEIVVTDGIKNKKKKQEDENPIWKLASAYDFDFGPKRRR